MSSYLQSHITLSLHGLARLREKLQPLHLHYHGAYGHQTSQDGDVPWEAPNYNVKQSFDYVVLQDHVTNKNHYISIRRVPMATKLGKMMTSLDGILLIMSHDHLITWPCEIRCSLRRGDSARRCLSCQRLLV